MEKMVYESRACGITRLYSADLMAEPGFEARADILGYLERWAMGEGASRRDERGEIKFARLTEEETDSDRSLRIQKWRIVARYFFPVAEAKSAGLKAES